MNVKPFVHHFPIIQDRIILAKLDAIVLGLGPTAWLYEWMRRDIFEGTRIWGAHDAFRVAPVNDLLLLDAPNGALTPHEDRFKTIYNSRPDRVWIYQPIAELWENLLHHDVLPRCTRVRFKVWDAKTVQGNEPFRLGTPGDHEPECCAVSPAACVTLAWHRGARRIGVLGMDMLPTHHNSWGSALAVDAFMTAMSRQAEQAGGLILNLSPITSLANFAAVSQSQFLTQRTATTVPPMRNVFSNDMAGIS